MNNSCLVSICIPCRNGEEVIGYTLANLLKNDFPHEKMEIIVGNHGSTDKTVEIVDQFQKEYPLIKIIDVPYLGPNRAFVRNRILDVAQGEIFICIDADIFVSRNFIQNHYDIHKNDKECLVAGYVYAKNSRTRSSVAVTSIDFSNINLSTPLLKESSDCKDSREVRGILIDQENIFDLTEKKDVWRYFWSANLSFSRHSYQLIGGFDERFVGWGIEDDELAYRYYVSGKKFVFAGPAWAFHFPHPLKQLKIINDWRNNALRFFEKWTNKEVELLYFFSLPSIGINLFERDLRYYPDNEMLDDMVGFVEKRLEKGANERLCGFLMETEHAFKLGITKALLPFSPEKNPFDIDGCTFYPIYGIQMPFKDKSIPESIILADTLFSSGEVLLYLYLHEVNRVSEKVIVFLGKLSTTDEYQDNLDRFLNILQNIPFNNLQIVNLT